MYCVHSGNVERVERAGKRATRDACIVIVKAVIHGLCDLPSWRRTKQIGKELEEGEFSGNSIGALDLAGSLSRVAERW